MNPATKSTDREVPTEKISYSRPLHPEEVKVGDFVSYQSLTYQFPSFYWDCVDLTVLPPDKPVVLNLLPSAENFPMKVKAVCVPFVLCRKSDKKLEYIDLRKSQLFRVDKEFGKQTLKMIRALETKKKKKKKSKKKKTASKKGKK